MKNIIQRIVAFPIIVVAVLLGGSGHGEASDYDENLVCFAQTYEYVVEGRGPSVVAVTEFEQPNYWPVLNAGSMSMSLNPCIPTACPEPYELASGNVCRLSADLPVSSTKGWAPNYAPTGEPIEAVFTVDVGPLVEPPIVQA